MVDSNAPQADSIAIENIPAELKDQTQWVCWEYQERDGKPGKVPIDPDTGTRASVTEADSWATFTTALLYYGSHDRIDGLGFVFTESDPFVGIDLDGCVDNAGNTDDTAEDIVSRLDSYTETSPSGTGLHIIIEGALPTDANRRDNVEIYERDRFFTVTGKHLKGTPLTVEQRQAGLEGVSEDYLEDATDAADADDTAIITGGGGDSPASGTSVFTDDELLAKAKGAKNAEKFARLWDGNTNEYPSQSEADGALCSRLAFWTGGDRAQIDRLFRQSRLMRAKWDEQHGDQTYGERTIDKTMKTTENRYDADFGQKSTDDQQTTHTTIEDVEEVVRSEFGDRTWNATETALAAHATNLLANAQCTGMVFTGVSGAGKSTVLDFFTGLDDQIYRSDDMTPASFVSHDASRTEEELREIDLLPRIKHKTLLNRDMAKWFAGPEDTIREHMATLANVMDGGGLLRDSGSHEQRGYKGDYRFNFLGASTPLPARSWRIMGHTGNRFVFYEVVGTKSREAALENVFERQDYSERVRDCREVVQEFFQQLWVDTGGHGNVEGQTTVPKTVQRILGYLGEVIRHGRAPFTEAGIDLEGRERIFTTLRDLARGHALLEGRTAVTLADVPVCARVALSTIPRERRSVIRALLDPANDGALLASDLERLTGLSRPTVHKRMGMLEDRQFAEYTEVENDERGSKAVTVRPEFEWPEKVDFPAF